MTEHRHEEDGLRARRIFIAGIVKPCCCHCELPIKEDDEMLMDCNRDGQFLSHKSCFLGGYRAGVGGTGRGSNVNPEQHNLAARDREQMRARGQG